MTTITQMLCNKFGGIRERNANFNDSLVTAQDIQNVELYYTGVNEGVGIRTAKGNTSITREDNHTNLTVYTIADSTATSAATDGIISSNKLTFSISDTTYSGLERSSDDDTSISNVVYYAWTDGENTYYTTTLGYIQKIPAGEQIIGMFESVQAGNYYLIVYTEGTQGKLYSYNIESKILTQLVSGLSVTGNACGCDISQGWNDYFVFSNGTNIKYIYSNSNTGQFLQVESAANIHLVDDENRTITGLGLKNFDKRLWIFNGKTVWYSSQDDCKEFRPSGNNVVTDAGYMECVKDVTAIYPYLGSLAIFHKDSSELVSVDATTRFSRGDESPGGCASYDSLIFHGTGLFFYDDTKKGVFSFQQVINGDKTLGDNVAIDIQNKLMLIDRAHLNKIKTLSVVTEDRNEIWFLVPISEDEAYSEILIFDYLKGEWIKRKSQHINCIATYKNKLYSGGAEIYEEYKEDTFNGEFIPHYYNCSPLNLGASNTLKVLVFPPRVTFNMPYTNKFYVKYIKNFNLFKTPKIKLVKTKAKNYLLWDVGYWDVNYWSSGNTNVISKFPSATFKTLEMQIYTTDYTQNFSIKNIEFSKIKVKQV